ncbi:MAG: hypothetical protein ACRDTC_24900 [Pseudonocardiaceae bacterium]
MAHESLAQDYRASVNGHPATLGGTGDIEILCAPEHLVPAAVGVLSWAGTVLPPAGLLGRRVVLVVELLTEVHDQRVASGWGPVTDRASVSTWGWPEMRHLAPPPAVRLRGVLAPARHWRTGLIAVAPFLALCPTALLLPPHIARDGRCLAYAAHYGPTIVADAGHHDPGAVDVVRPGRIGVAPTTSPNALSRWVHELVYDRLLRLSS